MAPNDPKTLGELLAWSYANLAMAHAAVTHGAAKYSRVHYMIRAKLYKGLRTGTMSMGSLLDDERTKMVAPPGCAYCGTNAQLTIDHLIPRYSGGPDSADNTVWACRSCNSSKGARDMFSWWASRDGAEVPPLLLVRRYLKVATSLARELGLFDASLDCLEGVPFSVQAIPTYFPRPDCLRLWATQDENLPRIR